jgi:signal transduction histidine kinase
MLNNLLDNAIKYTPPGGRIDVAVRRDTMRGKPRARVEIIDSGPGIPAADRERVFDRFYRGEPASGSNPPGSGLGLAIVQRIAERHGATIELRDAGLATADGTESGPGLRATIDFPLAPARDEPPVFDDPVNPT